MAISKKCFAAKRLHGNRRKAANGTQKAVASLLRRPKPQISSGECSSPARCRIAHLLRAQHPFGDDQIWHPAEPGNCLIGGLLRDFQREGKAEIDAQSHCRQGERNRPLAPVEDLLALLGKLDLQA